MISLKDCKHGFLYKTQSRNLLYGVFNSNNNGFIGIREKFGDRYLFTEYHWDTGEPFGTVKPLIELRQIPEEIVISECLGVADKKTGFNIAFCDLRRLWYKIDTGDECESPSPVMITNKKLFNYLANICES